MKENNKKQLLLFLYEKLENNHILDEHLQKKHNKNGIRISNWKNIVLGKRKHNC